MITKTQTACCALCQLSIPNDEPIENIKQHIELLKEESKKEYTPIVLGGQRAVFVITTEKEINLQKNLRNLGFVIANSFKRRNGYEPGMLTMWMLNW